MDICFTKSRNTNRSWMVLKMPVRRLIVYVSNTMKRNTDICRPTRILLAVLIFKQQPRCTHWLHSVTTNNINLTELRCLRVCPPESGIVVASGDKQLDG